MADRRTQAATQLANIETQTGMTVQDFTSAARTAQVAKHGEIMAMLKEQHELTHGNANLIAHLVREELDGGPTAEEDLVDLQYSGKKAALRPVLEELLSTAQAFGPDVETVIQKTGVSLRRAKQFAVIRAASATRIELGLNLDATPDDPRVQETKGMCSHRVDLASARDVDEDVAAWLHAAYRRAT